MLLTSWLKSVTKRIQVSRPSRKSHGRRGIYDKARAIAVPSAEMLETRTLLSAVTLASDVTEVGPVTESAVDEAAAGDDITVNAGVTIESTGSDITYLAGDDIILQAGSVTKAEGSITLSLDFGDADSGQGGVLSLADSGVLQSGVETSVFGGLDSDTFNIIPQLASSLSIVGDGGDNVLNLDLTGTTGASLQSTATGTTISFTSDHQPIQLNDISEINVSNGALAVNISDAQGQTDVAFDGGDLVVSIAGQEVLRTDALTVNGPLTVNGTDASDDILVIDFSNGNPIPNGINFNGGVGGNDTVEINGGSFANVGYTFTNENDGNVNWDGTTLIYSGLEPIIDNSNAVDRVFTFAGGAETITLSDDGTASDGFSLIDSTLGESVVFQNPTGSLTVNAGSGVDVIDLLAVDDATSIPALTVNGGDEADTINGGGIAAGTFTSVILNGNAGNDTIIGTDGVDTINGGTDNDTITGGLGADLQFGNAGNDLFIWNNGDGPDDNTGGTDVDTFTFNGADGADDVLNLFAGPGDGSLVGAAFTLERTAPSAFTIEGVEIENINVNGLAGNDTVDGSTLPTGIFTNVTINGGDGNDNLTGTDGVDTINGGADNDTITGGRGADLQFGNAGNDLFIWNNGDGPDDNTGGADVDTFTFNGADGADDVLNLFAGPGDGSLVGAAFTLERTAPSAFTIEGVEIENINVNGLAGNDTVDGSALPAGIFTNVTINGGDGNDNLTGTDGVDTINGGANNDTITGGRGADLQFGDAGNDLFIWNNGDGPDDNTGGADVDTFTFNGADGADDVLNLFAGPGDGSLVGAAFTLERTAPSAFTIEGVEIENINVNGLAGDDTVDGSALPTGIFTNVTINGGDGNDNLTGTDGVDTINGGADNDTITGGRGADLQFGDAGNDLFIWNNGDGPDDNTGGADVDTFTFNGADGADDVLNLFAGPGDGSLVGAAFTLERTAPSAFTIEGVEIENINVNGLAGNDTVDGSALPAGIFTNVTINGGDGNDNLTGTDGVDTINGGADNDTITGGRGADLQFGDAGNDLFIWNNGDGPDDNTGGADVDTFTFNGADGADDVLNLFAGPGDGSLFGAAFTLERTAPSAFTIEGVEIENINVNGLAGNDTVDGSALPAGIFTNVTINGGDGNDNLTGTDGVDTINGGADNDTITGGRGADLQFGNAGNDLFIWNNGDGPDDNTGGADVDTFTFNGADGADDVLNLFAGPGDGSLVGAAFTLERTDPSAFTIEGVEIENINVNGLAGNDTVDGSALPAGIFTNVTINGGSGNDNLTGTDGVDTINGGADNDTITGGRGADLQFGDAGNDLFIWNNGDGPDDNTGGADVDTFTFNGADGADDVLNLFAGPGDGSLVGAAFTLERTAPSAFTIEGVEIENINVNGLAGNDTVDGSALPAGIFTNVTINGGDGNDNLTGTDGVDTINGGADNDTITGGRGADLQFGDAGNDLFIWNNGDGPDDNTGGADVDTFTFNGADGADDVLNLFAGPGDGSLVGAAFTLERTAPSAFTIEGVEIENINVNGLAGDDTVDGSALPAGIFTNVTINGGDGNDNLTGTDGVDTINGGANNDTITGGRGADLQFGNAGNDLFIWNNGDGPDDNTGGADVDTFTFNGADGADDVLNLFAGPGDGSLVGAAFTLERTAPSAFTIEGVEIENINVNGLAGNDTIDGSALPTGIFTNVTINGGAGDDLLTGTQGVDVIDGGTGNDTNSFQGIQLGVTATINADGTGTAAYGNVNEAFTGIENLIGSNNDDILTAIGEVNGILNGAGGNDVLNGGTGTTLIGGDGIDSTSIDFGDEAVFLDLSNSTNGLRILERFRGETRTIDGFESIQLLTGDFRNVFRVFAQATPDLQKITIDAGNGNNFINAWRTDLIIDVTTGSGNDVIWTGLANDIVSSGDGRDIIWTNSGDDIVDAGNGNNLIIAGFGNDVVNAGSGRDILRGGGGNDYLNSGAGNDRIFGSSGDDTVIAGAGNDVLFGGWGDDTLDAGDGNDVAFGHLGNDTITGGGGNDRLYGGSGDDALDGGAGNDWVIGNSGNDILIGGSGHDRIWGGTGRDLLFGGTGRDWLFGGSNDDLLISGSTTLNTNQLQSVRSEWASNRSIQIRLANITDGTGSTDRLNGDALLNTSTLEADQDRDRLFGQSGVDAFFASASDGTVRSHFESLLDL